MNEGVFDRIMRVRATSASRRGVVAGLGRGFVGALSLALVGSSGAAEADAKGKKKRRRKHKRKRGATSSPQTTPSSPQTPPTGPGFCALDGPDMWVTTGRVAQTFLPPKAGQLTQAAIFLESNPANFSLTFDIRPVDGAGVPTNTVLSSHTVNNIPKTVFGGSPRLVTANFVTPATLTLGQLYALSVTGPGTDQYWVHIRGGNACTDGQMFHDLPANASFVAIAGGNADLIYLSLIHI